MFMFFLAFFNAWHLKKVYTFHQSVFYSIADMRIGENSSFPQFYCYLYPSDTREPDEAYYIFYNGEKFQPVEIENLNGDGYQIIDANTFVIDGEDRAHFFLTFRGPSHVEPIERKNYIEYRIYDGEEVIHRETVVSPIIGDQRTLSVFLDRKNTPHILMVRGKISIPHSSTEDVDTLYYGYKDNKGNWVFESIYVAPFHEIDCMGGELKLDSEGNPYITASFRDVVDVSIVIFGYKKDGKWETSVIPDTADYYLLKIQRGLTPHFEIDEEDRVHHLFVIKGEYFDILCDEIFENGDWHVDTLFDNLPHFKMSIYMYTLCPRYFTFDADSRMHIIYPYYHYSDRSIRSLYIWETPIGKFLIEDSPYTEIIEIDRHFIPHGVGVDNYSLWRIWRSSSGVKEKFNRNNRIIMNNFQISIPYSGTKRISIYGIDGRKIKSFSTRDDVIYIKSLGLNKGVYFLVMETNDRKIIYKFVELKGR